MALLGNCGRPAGADAVTTHHDWPALAIGVEVVRTHGLAVKRPKLKDVADFNRPLADNAAPQTGQGMPASAVEMSPIRSRFDNRGPRLTLRR